MYLSHILTIFQKISKIRGATPLASYHPIHQIWACAHLFGTLIYTICIISSIFYGNTWSKFFSKNTKLFLHFLKSVNNKHTFFELVSSWSVYQFPPWKTVTLWKRNMAKHYGEDLCFEQDGVIIQKYKKINKSKKSKSSLSWKPKKAT